MSTVDLKAIFYSEFDNTHGHKIIHQSPTNFLSEDQFRGLSGYIMGSPWLYGKTTTVDIFGDTVMCYLLSITDPIKYNLKRNTFIFCVGFVFEQDTDTEPYQSPLRMIASTLQSMEVESQYLTDRQGCLGKVIRQVLKGLQNRGEVSTCLDKANMLNLRLLRPPTEQTLQVQDHDVPVFRVDAKGLGFEPGGRMELACDLALQQVVPHIDGIKCTKKISLYAKVDIDVVKRCLRALLHYNRIALVDLFQYSNHYVPTVKTAEVGRIPGFERAYSDYLVLHSQGLGNRPFSHAASQQSSQQSNHQSIALEPPPSWSTILRIYCSFQSYGTGTVGRTVHSVMTENINLVGDINIQRLVILGVIHGVLKRVHCYPTLVQSNWGSSSSLKAGCAGGVVGTTGGGGTVPGSLSSSASLRREARRLMDGTRSEDELCCYFMKPLDALDRSDPSQDSQFNVLRIYK